jgi:hypothetical protein
MSYLLIFWKPDNFGEVEAKSVYVADAANIYRTVNKHLDPKKHVYVTISSRKNSEDHAVWIKPGYESESLPNFK